MPRKKKAEEQPEPLVNHPLVKRAIKVLKATVVEPGSEEASKSPFSQQEVEATQAPREDTSSSAPESPHETSGNREDLLRQYGALADGDATISANRGSRR